VPLVVHNCGSENNRTSLPMSELRKPCPPLTAAPPLTASQ
jgi:hypothetical protein